ncbi:DUF3710 domain-containing protein [Psychromicrobium xiongbiense]|uniref:DUF3710 domain-containing protein n=1 Tax=Psychromicrobium xiongbiense TaxID=3051184 RepID=UPI002556301E|nr:DUF3710 domain-containing protein [Psychromicrobium sp. YIM S02556]
MVFGRRKKGTVSQETSPVEDLAADAVVEDSADSDVAEAENADAVSEAADDVIDYDRATHGPFDIDEVDEREGYIDLGALLLHPHDDMQLRLEVEESSQRIVAVTLDLHGSSLQLQGFAAPRTEGLWVDIRDQIAESVSSQGGTTETLEGTFGPELLAKLPAEASDGSRGFRVARFIGVDGPRWFLRGVLGGTAAMEREAASELEDLFRSVVVIRGEVPMPPRDLLPLRLPKDAVEASEARPQAEGASLPSVERGPEITEVG